MTGFYYLVSPYLQYLHGLDAAYDAAVQARGLLIKAGVPCFSPIVHSHPVAKACGIDPCDHAIWLPAERPMFDAAMGLIVLKLNGWAESFGVREERKLFVAAGKSIVFMEPGTVPPELLPDRA